MKFGGLSEKEVDSISTLLESKKIEFEVIMDESILNSNNVTLHNDLRHFSSPSVSTYILAIEIKDGAFATMDESLKKSLLDFGITDQVPEEFDIDELTLSDEDPIVDLKKINVQGNRNIVGFNFGLEIIIGILILICWYYISKS
jgi:hypothetical protein